MVKIEEVKDASFEDRESDYETDSNASDSSSISSFDEDELDISSETLTDRLVALKDIIPPSTRLSLSRHFANTASFVTWGGKWAGNAVWVLTTSALLVGLPLALAIEDEARIVQQEKEMQMQQSGQQSLLGAPQSSGGLVPPGF